MKKGFTLVEIMIVLAIIGLIVAIAVPAFLKNRQDAQGAACNAQLDQIFSAKEQTCFKKNIKAGMAGVAITAAELNEYLRGLDLTETNPCPMGGTYSYSPLNDSTSGQASVPTCDQETVAAGDSGHTWGEEGLHIHRRSFVQDTNGVYSRDTTKYTYN